MASIYTTSCLNFATVVELHAQGGAVSDVLPPFHNIRAYFTLEIVYASWHNAFNQSRSSGLPGQISNHATLILAVE